MRYLLHVPFHSPIPVFAFANAPACMVLTTLRNERPDVIPPDARASLTRDHQPEGDPDFIVSCGDTPLVHSLAL